MKSQSLSKSKKVLLLTSLILATIVPMNDLFIIPAADSIFAYFSDSNVSILNFILSGPALISLIVAPISGKLMGVIRKKQLLLGGMILFSIGACLGLLVKSPLYMAAMRCLVGAAVGTIAPCCMAILSDFFTDEKELGTMMGIWNAGMSAMGAIISIVAGIVASIQWELVFRLYLVVLPIIVIMFITIPNETPAEKSRADKSSDNGPETDSGKESTPWARVLVSLFGYFMGNMTLSVVYYQISMYVSETGIGSASLAGSLSTTLTAVTFVACLAFGFLYSHARKFIPFIIFGFSTLCYAFFAFLPSVPGAFLGMALNGVANGLILSYYPSYLVTLVPENQSPFILSLSTSTLGLGMFLSTYFCTLLKNIGNGTMINVCFILTIASAVFMVAALLRHLKEES